MDQIVADGAGVGERVQAARAGIVQADDRRHIQHWRQPESVGVAFISAIHGQLRFGIDLDIALHAVEDPDRVGIAASVDGERAEEFPDCDIVRFGVGIDSHQDVERALESQGVLSGACLEGDPFDPAEAHTRTRRLESRKLGHSGRCVGTDHPEAEHQVARQDADPGRLVARVVDVQLIMIIGPRAGLDVERSGNKGRKALRVADGEQLRTASTMDGRRGARVRRRDGDGVSATAEENVELVEIGIVDGPRAEAEHETVADSAVVVHRAAVVVEVHDVSAA